MLWPGFGQVDQCVFCGDTFKEFGVLGYDHSSSNEMLTGVSQCIIPEGTRSAFGMTRVSSYSFA